MNQGWVYIDRITAAEADLTILDFYATRYRHPSWTDWFDRILSRQIPSEWNSCKSQRSPLHLGLYPGGGYQPLPGDTGYHLHAFRLELLQPRTQRPLEVVAPPPSSLTG